MKILIWIGSFIVCTLVTAIFDALLKPLGIRLGWLVRYLIAVPAMFFLARHWCLKWEEKIFKKLQDKANKEGLSVEEFLTKDVPKVCLELAEEYRGCPVELSAFLDDCVKSGKITREQAQNMYQVFIEK